MHTCFSVCLSWLERFWVSDILYRLLLYQAFIVVVIHLTLTVWANWQNLQWMKLNGFLSSLCRSQIDTYFSLVPGQRQSQIYRLFLVSFCFCWQPETLRNCFCCVQKWDKRWRMPKGQIPFGKKKEIAKIDSLVMLGCYRRKLIFFTSPKYVHFLIMSATIF